MVRRLEKGSRPWVWVLGLTFFVMAVTVGRSGMPVVGEPPLGPTDDARVLQLFEGGRSGEMVTVAGTVERTLSDDDDGSRHQRFILRLTSGLTLLVAHNIDLAPRVPLGPGDRIRVRGQYEWNDQGGVLHWTHHDPDGDRPGGWIEAGGQEYR